MREIAVANDTDYFTSNIRNEPEVLDADMTKSDLVDVLRRLKFDIDHHHHRYSTIWLNRPVRDFLITALTDSRRK
jgi:hypothetical protein